MANNKLKYGGDIKPSYDSDKDLSKEAQQKIKNAKDPEAERKKQEEQAGSFYKMKSLFKKGLYGDKRNS